MKTWNTEKIINHGFKLLCIILLLVVFLCEDLRGQEPPSIRQVEIVPYRIYPTSHPTMGCWSELELMGESEMSEEVREKLIDSIIKVELYNEMPEYLEINNKQYYLLRLPIDSFHDYNVGFGNVYKERLD